MKKNYLFLLIVILFIPSCGYNPIYSDVNSETVRLNILKITGDEEMNNMFEIQSKKFTNIRASKSFDLNVNTNYEKNILIKNKSGGASSYSIKTVIEFELVNTEKSRKFVFSNETKTESMSKEYELKKYERTIKSNFINSKLEELILQLSNIE